MCSSDLKEEIRKLKIAIQKQESRIGEVHDNESESELETTDSDNSQKEIELTNQNQDQFISMLNKVVYQKWYIKINIIINQQYTIRDVNALVDSGADLNCIQEGLVPTRYFKKTRQSLTSASGSRMQIQYKLSEVSICNKGICIPS